MSCCTGKTVDLPRQTPDCKATEQGLCVLFFKKATTRSSSSLSQGEKPRQKSNGRPILPSI